MLRLSSILIVYERLKDSNNKNKNLNAKIYHIVLKTILHHCYFNLLPLTLRKKNLNYILAMLEHKKGIELVYTDS